jgi:hypothetical protein
MPIIPSDSVPDAIWCCMQGITDVGGEDNLGGGEVEFRGVEGLLHQIDCDKLVQALGFVGGLRHHLVCLRCGRHASHPHLSKLLRHARNSPR